MNGNEYTLTHRLYAYYWNKICRTLLHIKGSNWKCLAEMESSVLYLLFVIFSWVQWQAEISNCHSKVMLGTSPVPTGWSQATDCMRSIPERLLCLISFIICQRKDRELNLSGKDTLMHGREKNTFEITFYL